MFTHKEVRGMLEKRKKEEKHPTPTNLNTDCRVEPTICVADDVCCSTVCSLGYSVGKEGKHPLLIPNITGGHSK